jgi:hypothetical protein
MLTSFALPLVQHVSIVYLQPLSSSTKSEQFGNIRKQGWPLPDDVNDKIRVFPFIKCAHPYGATGSTGGAIPFKTAYRHFLVR